MNLQPRKRLARFIPGNFSTQSSAGLLSLTMICAVSFVTTARATTLLDPLPEPSTTLFGYTVTSIGDLNGDGVPDYVVGAPFQDGDFVSTITSFGVPQNVGKIFVIDGASLAVLVEMNDPEFEQIQARHFGGQLGASLAVSADINGDGIADVIAGVPHHIQNGNGQTGLINLAGEALVFSGKDGTVLFTLKDPTAEEDGKFGTAVAALGDVDGDGVADFVVGTPGKDIGGEDGIPNVGIAYVFSGKTGQVIRTLNDPPRGGAEAGAAFGSAIANAGDVDGDGVCDIAIGAPGEGRVHVFSGKTGNLLYSIISPVADALPSFGASVAGGQDFNRDRKPDIVVGAPLASANRGAVYVYNGANGTLIRQLKPPVPQAFARFGAAVYASPDLTGDKRADIIVGAPGQNVNGLNGAGQAYIYDGTKGRLNKTLTSETPQAGAGYGTALTSVLPAGSSVSIPVVGVPYQDNASASQVHLQIGQIEISQ
ncbi:MAG: FG-GAP-like repeat-containing protein [Chthoniobacterales bacterium]